MARILVSLLLSLALVISVFSTDRRERKPPTLQEKQRYTPYLSPLLLPGFLMALLLLAPLITGVEKAAQLTLSVCFGIFLHISIYYILLLLLLPLLRKWFSARACGVLWLIPNYLYITQATYMELPAPKWVIHPPTGLILPLFSLWFTGVLLYLGFKILEHIRFRRKILKTAAPVSDENTLAIWEQVRIESHYDAPHLRLLRSPMVATPLSLGLFRRTLLLVLPQKDYTASELKFIFQHELIHLCRQDNATKFFMVFCTAVCWFNPLMWAAMKKSSQDLELSCDETVLLNKDRDARQAYARLILSSAGHSQGFTTCLSPGAATLRYRLRHIVTPARKLTGGILVGLCFFLLCMTCGYVALAYETGTGVEIIFSQSPQSAYELQYITWQQDGLAMEKDCENPEALRQFLSELKLSKITGNYSFQPSNPHIFIAYATPQGKQMAMYLTGQKLTITYFEKDLRQESYYLEATPDWGYLSSLLS